MSESDGREGSISQNDRNNPKRQTMKKAVVEMAVAMGLGGLSARAQIELQTPEGSRQYYRMVSAKATFRNQCLEDNKGKAENSDEFRIEPYNDQSARQLWEFIPNTDTTSYYIRNKETKRYLGKKPVLISETYYYVKEASAKSQAAAWEVSTVGNGQHLFSYVDDYGVVRFMNAANVNITPDRITTAIQNSRFTGFAWYLVKEGEDPTGILPLQAESDVSVAVVGRQIIVTGTDHYELYSIEGRRQTLARELQPGLYIVRAGGRTFKLELK